MKQTNKNFLFNIIYQIFIFIIPLITVPYISRVLGVNNIGIYSYTYSIVYYFMLFSMLGINNYGAREIAKCKNIDEKSKKFWDIYYLQIFLVILSSFVYFLILAFIPFENKNIMTIQYIFLLSVLFDVNWFFFGEEKFLITITRNVIIKLLSLILVFLFIKQKSDLTIYTLIMSVSTLISQLYLWLFLKKEVIFEKPNVKRIIKNIKPCLILFIPVISYSIYRVMDKTMIGGVASTIELGYYENAEKIINIPVAFVTALGTVMLPHMSKKTEKEIIENIYSTFELTFFVILPMILGLVIVGKDFSTIFFGKEFIKTGNIIRILTLSVLFSSIANVIRTNYLIPMKKDKIYVLSTIVGALFNFICNIVFIKRFGAYGACIGTIVAEFSVMAYQVIKTKKIINFKKVFIIFIKYLIKSLIMAAAIFIIGLFIKNIVIKFIVQIILAVLIYFILNKNYILYEFIGKRRNVKC